MSFEVIPAIDVSAGKLARLTASGTVPLEAFRGDPVAAAQSFVDSGAAWIHVVDMDRAMAGTTANTELLQRIAQLGVQVQASGGFSASREIEAALEAGATRVVLGSAGLLDRDAAELTIEFHGASLVVGIEADGARILPRGAEGRELSLWETLQWLETLKVERFLYTEVGRVGSLAGPDLDGVWALAKSTGRPVIASGGIRNLDDLRALAALRTGVEGAVVGRALYEGLDLRAARAAVA